MLKRIRESIKIDAFNLQSIFTVDINKYSNVFVFFVAVREEKKPLTIQNYEAYILFKQGKK